MTRNQNPELAATVGNLLEPPRLTKEIEIVSFGESACGNRYVKLARGKGLKPVLLRIDNLTANRSAAFQFLNRKGLHLVSPSAQAELIKRIQEHRPRRKDFSVAEEIGMFYDECFVLPDGTIPPFAGGRRSLPQRNSR